MGGGYGGHRRRGGGCRRHTRMCAEVMCGRQAVCRKDRGADVDDDTRAARWWCRGNKGSVRRQLPDERKQRKNSGEAGQAEK